MIWRVLSTPLVVALWFVVGGLFTVSTLVSWAWRLQHSRRARRAHPT